MDWQADLELHVQVELEHLVVIQLVVGSDIARTGGDDRLLDAVARGVGDGNLGRGTERVVGADDEALHVYAAVEHVRIDEIGIEGESANALVGDAGVPFTLVRRLAVLKADEPGLVLAIEVGRAELAGAGFGVEVDGKAAVGTGRHTVDQPVVLEGNIENEEIVDGGGIRRRESAAETGRVLAALVDVLIEHRGDLEEIRNAFAGVVPETALVGEQAEILDVGSGAERILGIGGVVQEL